jgi:hypothetical protein
MESKFDVGQNVTVVSAGARAPGRVTGIETPAGRPVIYIVRVALADLYPNVCGESEGETSLYCNARHLRAAQ